MQDLKHKSRASPCVCPPLSCSCMHTFGPDLTGLTKILAQLLNQISILPCPAENPAGFPIQEQCCSSWSIWVCIGMRVCIVAGGSGSSVYLICRNLKLCQWRKLCFLVQFYSEMSFKCFNGSHKVVLYDSSSIMSVDISMPWLQFLPISRSRFQGQSNQD